MTDVLLGCIGKTDVEIRKLVEAAMGSWQDCFLTAFVLLVLCQSHADVRDVWEPAFQKGLAYLKPLLDPAVHARVSAGEILFI
jgi:hypothetical protein